MDLVIVMTSLCVPILSSDEKNKAVSSRILENTTKLQTPENTDVQVKFHIYWKSKQTSW